MIVRSSILTLAALLGATALTAQDGATVAETTHLLRYSFAKGASGHLQVNSRQNGQMDMGGQKMDIDQKLIVTLGWQVTEVTDGKAGVNLQIERIQLDMTVPMMGQMKWDSADEDSEPPAMMRDIADAIGATADYKLDNRGTISDFEAQEVNVPGLNLAETTKQWLPLLPEQPVAVGHKWTSQQDINADQMGTIQSLTTYTVVSADAKQVELSMETKMELQAGEDAGGVEAEFKDCSGKSTLLLAKPVPEAYSSTATAKMMMGPGMEMTMKLDNSARNYVPPKKDEAGEKGDGKDADKRK